MEPIYRGPVTARVMVIGEYLGWDEVNQRKPFVGASGAELFKMGAEAGLDLDNAFMTNILHRVPDRGDIKNHFLNKTEAKKLGLDIINGKYPDAALREGRDWVLSMIEKIEPELIITLGGTALWALTGETKITSWRGSILEFNGIKLIPTNNPALIFKNWTTRWIIVQDFRRAVKENLRTGIQIPPWEFQVRPNANQALELIESLRGKKSALDIETRKRQISCIGFAESKLKAFCIPFQSVSNPYGYFTKEEEVEVRYKLLDVMTDPDTSFITHGGVYDCQYIAKEFGALPNINDDTMIAWRVAFPSLPKGLDFLASIVCDYHCFWKNDGREWDPKKHPEERHWVYNCRDCVTTYEVWEHCINALEAYGLMAPYREIEMEKFFPSLKMTLRGTLTDQVYKNKLKGELLVKINERERWLEDVLGHPFNQGSPIQMQRLFYTDFKVRPVISRKTRRPTCDDEALEEIARRQPLLRPLVEVIQEIRSLNIFYNNYAEAVLDKDGRMRATFHFIPESFRFSCSKNAFDTGINMQTISKGNEDD